MSIRLLLLVIAMVLFAVTAVGWAPPRGNLIAAGLFFFAGAFLAPG